MERDIAAVVAVVDEVMEYLADPETDVAWSHYETPSEARADLAAHRDRLIGRDFSKVFDLELLFAPTGALQEIAISSGWGEEFLNVARNFDAAIARLRR